MSTPDPSRILDTLCAYWQSEALNAAVDLGIFTAVGQGARTAPRLAARCKASGDRVERLCDYLVALGFLLKRGGRYRAAADTARFLDANSREAAASIARFYHSASMKRAFASLAVTVRGRGGASELPRDLWPTFARATLPLKRLEARVFADELVKRRITGGRLLDVGAGASPLGIELLRRWPRASLTVQDSADVAAIALQHARSARVGRRVTALAGDARVVELGGPFDLVLLTNVLDYFDTREQARLLQRLRRSLAPGGTLALSAPALHAGPTPRHGAASYDLMLLALGAPGRPMPVTALTRALRLAGFTGIERSSTLPLLLARRRR